jgi:hypothetical protein
LSLVWWVGGCCEAASLLVRGGVLSVVVVVVGEVSYSYVRMSVWYGGVTCLVVFVQCVFGVKLLSGVLVWHGGRVEFIQGGMRVLMG